MVLGAQSLFPSLVKIPSSRSRPAIFRSDAPCAASHFISRIAASSLGWSTSVLPSGASPLP